MSEKDITVDFRAKINQETGRLEISILSESEPDAAKEALNSIFRLVDGSDDDPLRSVQVKSAKTDPESMGEESRLRPMWTKTTCDIIK